jgi:hypothetical protein
MAQAKNCVSYRTVNVELTERRGSGGDMPESRCAMNLASAIKTQSHNWAM